jgi:hypothetical protein
MSRLSQLAVTDELYFNSSLGKGYFSPAAAAYISPPHETPSSSDDHHIIVVSVRVDKYDRKSGLFKEGGYALALTKGGLLSLFRLSCFSLRARYNVHSSEISGFALSSQTQLLLGIVLNGGSPPLIVRSE